MKTISMIVTILISLTMVFQANASGGGDDRLKEVGEYNLEEGVSLKGYDPVSYFSEDLTATGQKGDTEVSIDHQGVTYLFASEQNLNVFIDEAIKNKQEGIKTLKFEPTYGGWCAYAMACLLYTSPSPRDQRGSRMPSSA